jgi:hypothetical protein
MKIVKICIKCFMKKNDCYCGKDRRLHRFCDDCNSFVKDCECKKTEEPIKDIKGQLKF